MNNCPKCGNPLQTGTASCPICGTNIINTAAPAQTTEAGKATVTVASVATPAAAPVAPAQPVATPAPAAPTAQPAVAPVTQPVTPAPVSTPAQTTAAPAPQVAPTPTVVQPAAPVAPAPAVEPAKVEVAPAQPVVPTPAPAPVEPATTTVEPAPVAAPVEPVDPNAIAPTVKTIEAPTPVPSIPASLTNEAPTENVVNVEVKTVKPKKKMNKNVLVIAGILAVVVIAGVLMMNMGKKPVLNQTPNPTDQTSALNLTSVSTNGFKFNLQEGWVITEDGYNVVVTNKDETVAIKLDYTKNGLESISKDTIESFFNSREDFTNTKVTETKISAKDAYLVDTEINQARVQLYYINGGTNLTLGATIVYQSAETKTLYEANVAELLGSLSYSDDSIKALNSLEMYSNIFNAYNGVFQYQENNYENEYENNNSENNEYENNENENTEDSELQEPIE